MTYSRRIDRLSPALIIVLVDQSDSMAEAIKNSTQSKAQAVADQINTLLYELILRCVKSPREPPRAYFSVSVIGYSTNQHGDAIIEPALAAATGDGVTTTTELVESPIRVEGRPGPSGGTINTPVWVEPVSHGGTPMCAALNHAGQLAASWVARYPSAFPPVVVNLSDGEATDGDPSVWARRLQSLSTVDGHLLLFNLSMSSDPGMASLFPSDTGGLTNPFAAKLFQMSSLMPAPMMDIARLQGIGIRPNARGFACNADIKALAMFLNVGTSIGRVAR
jgi:hypothetical protein